MLKKTITYRDYNDVERTEDFYFNLTKAEIMEMELGTTGGFTEMVQKITWFYSYIYVSINVRQLVYCISHKDIE